MLLRNNAAVTSNRNDNATCPTSSALATVTLRTLRPAVRASWRMSETPARETLSAGTTPKMNPLANDTRRVKSRTGALTLDVVKMPVAGRDLASSCMNTCVVENYSPA